MRGSSRDKYSKKKKRSGHLAGDFLLLFGKPHYDSHPIWRTLLIKNIANRHTALIKVAVQEPKNVIGMPTSLSKWDQVSSTIRLERIENKANIIGCHHLSGNFTAMIRIKDASNAYSIIRKANGSGRKK